MPQYFERGLEARTHDQFHRLWSPISFPSTFNSNDTIFSSQCFTNKNYIATISHKKILKLYKYIRFDTKIFFSVVYTNMTLKKILVSNNIYIWNFIFSIIFLISLITI